MRDRLDLAEVDDDVDPLGHGDTHAGHLHGVRQQVAVGGDLPERQEVGAVPQRPFPPARRAGRIEPEPIAPLLDVQVRLDRAVGEEAVAEDAVQVEQVEHRLAGRCRTARRGRRSGCRIRSARQVQAGAGNAGVQVVEQVVAAEHALVDVLGGEIEVVIVVPQRAQRLVRVARRAVFRIGEAGVHVRIVLVLEAVRVDRVRVVDRVEVVDRVAVAFRRGMAVVQMGRHLGDAEILRDLHRRQLVLDSAPGSARRISPGSAAREPRSSNAKNRVFA